MKFAPFFFRAAACVLAVGFSGLRAQENTPAALAASPADANNGKFGYTVTVDIKVDENGETDATTLVSSNDKSTGDFITKLAMAMAIKTEMPKREKDGKPITYTARVPYFFPIADDEGEASDNLPKPKVKNAVQPAYPLELREQGVVGGAVLELIVDAAGKLTQLKTLRASHPEFEASARESVGKWDFTAAQQNGRAVESRSRLAIVYETEGRMAELQWRVPPRPSLGTFVVIRPNEPIPDDVESDAKAPETPAPAATK